MIVVNSVILTCFFNVIGWLESHFAALLVIAGPIVRPMHSTIDYY